MRTCRLIYVSFGRFPVNPYLHLRRYRLTRQRTSVRSSFHRSHSTLYLTAVRPLTRPPRLQSATNFMRLAPRGVALTVTWSPHVRGGVASFSMTTGIPPDKRDTVITLNYEKGGGPKKIKLTNLAIDRLRRRSRLSLVCTNAYQQR